MIVIAHVGGVPVEELIPAVAGAGSMMLLARAWLSVRLRPGRRRHARGTPASTRSL